MTVRVRTNTLGGPGALEHLRYFVMKCFITRSSVYKSREPVPGEDAKKQLLSVHEMLDGSLRMGPAHRTGLLSTSLHCKTSAEQGQCQPPS